MGIVGIINEINTSSDFYGAMELKSNQEGGSDEEIYYERDDQDSPKFINSVVCGSFWSKLRISDRDSENLFLTIDSDSEFKFELSINEKTNRSVDIVFSIDDGSEKTSVNFNVKFPNKSWAWVYFYIDFENFDNSFLLINEDRYTCSSVHGTPKSVAESLINKCQIFEESNFFAESMFARIWIDFDLDMDSDKFFSIRRRFVKKSSWVLIPLNLGLRGEMPTGNIPLMYGRFAANAVDLASAKEFDYDSNKIEFKEDSDLIAIVEA